MLIQESKAGKNGTEDALPVELTSVSMRGSKNSNILVVAAKMLTKEWAIVSKSPAPPVAMTEAFVKISFRKNN